MNNASVWRLPAGTKRRNRAARNFNIGSNRCNSMSRKRRPKTIFHCQSTCDAQMRHLHKSNVDRARWTWTTTETTCVRRRRAATVPATFATRLTSCFLPATTSARQVHYRSLSEGQSENFPTKLYCCTREIINRLCSKLYAYRIPNSNEGPPVRAAHCSISHTAITCNL